MWPGFLQCRSLCRHFARQVIFLKLLSPHKLLGGRANREGKSEGHLIRSFIMHWGSSELEARYDGYLTTGLASLWQIFHF